MILAARTPQISHVLSNSTGFLKYVQSVPLTVRVTACKKYTGSPFVADKQVQRPIIYYNYNTLASEFIGSTHIKFVRRTSPYSTMPSRGIITQVDDIIKSPEDNRSYRGLELSNKLRVLLVSDPTTDKSSAAMDVHIGHMSDPSELPGLAHFCEHMLFLGTKKYPSENEYNKFLSEHGGSSNAFTSAEHTNFYFDVAAENLSGALDRFSQFFVEPLFTASATDREVNAVNSENDKNLQSDLWRLHQLERSTANANHAYSKFGTGNKYTLETRPKERGIDVREELLKFHSKYYSANGMGLAVLGKESLDELSEMVVSMFSGVQNKDITIPEWPIHPYGPNEVKLQAHVVPVKDLRNLNVTWPIPDLEPYYKSNPGHYLGHLLGHEGAGSLLSELKSRGWVNHLVGGQKNGAKGFMFIIVNVDLTEEGIKHTDDIVMLINQYLNLLRKEGPQEWIFKECQDLSAMTFRFKDKEKPASYTSSLAAAIHDYPMKEVLCGGYLLEEYRADLIEMVLDKLTPDNTRIAVIGQQFEGKTDLEEEWYKTQYSLKAIEENMLQSWRNPGFSPNLRLPDRNEFIPTNFDLVTREEEQCPIPQLVRDTAMTRLWFRQDDKFLLPKACIYVDFISAHAYVDPPAANMCYMFVRLLQDSLNEYAYAAELAGIHYKIQSTIYGLTVTAKGYNDKLPILLHRIVDKMCTFEIDPQRFNILKEEYVRSLKNFRAEQPHQHAIYHTATLMAEQMWTKEELLEATDELTLDGLRTFVPHLLSRVYLEMLAYGNMTKQKSMEVADAVENILQTKCNTKPLQQSQQRRFREVQLPDGCYYVYRQKNEVHSSSSLEVYYQCSVQDTHANMMLELFCHIIAEPCFDILRTQEQLGYIVFSGVRRSNGAQGLRVIVQSDKSPQFVESRIEAFLAKMESHIHEMTDEVYQKHVGALASRRLEKPKKLGAQALKYWGEIVSQQYNFDRDNLEVAHLKTLTKDDIFKFYKDMIASDAPHRHKLSVHVIADAQQTNGDNANDASGTETGTQQITQSALDGIVMEPPGCEEPVEVTDKTAFKRSMALFPLPKPVFNFAQAKSKL